MGRSLTISILVHVALLALLIWSDRLRLSFLQSERERLKASGVTQIDITYKPTDTAMRKGREKRDLPPPDVAVPPPPPEDKSPTLKEKKDKKKEAEAKKKAAEAKELEAAKRNKEKLLEKFKRDARAEDRPKPKIDNFPVSQKGEVGARGTGGRSQRTLSPAELALQGAMRKYFEFPEAREFRKAYPNIEGYIEVSLVGIGDHFSIRALRILATTGFTALDRSCEVAIRKAIDEETFSHDVVKELSGKDSAVICKP